MSESHIPVLLEPAVDALQVKPDHWYIDATFGRGGHTQEILKRSGLVIGFDYDQQNIDDGQRKFSTELAHHQLILIRENFDHMAEAVRALQQDSKVGPIDGVLFDLGTTVEQLTDQDRGLSFQGDETELDMRLDDRLGVTAKDLLAVLSQKQLSHVFGTLGGERESRRISQEISRRRQNGEFITTTAQLVELVEKTKHHKSRHIHPATKVFQALRIAVNDELSNLERALPQALELVQPSGRIVTIAFHEGEDRICKHSMKEWEEAGAGERTSKDVFTPTPEELQKNPRSRSAKMRVFSKK